jgi:hypothetical protein
MVNRTLIIVGPAGVGKGPLAKVIRDDAIAIDPYRSRKAGPRRDSGDPLYAPAKLRMELRSVLSSLGDSPCEIPCEGEQLEWYRNAKVLFFTVRLEWQCPDPSRDQWRFCEGRTVRSCAASYSQHSGDSRSHGCNTSARAESGHRTTWRNAELD